MWCRKAKRAFRGKAQSTTAAAAGMRRRLGEGKREPRPCLPCTCCMYDTVAGARLSSNQAADSYLAQTLTLPSVSTHDSDSRLQCSYSTAWEPSCDVFLVWDMKSVLTGQLGTLNPAHSPVLRSVVELTWTTHTHSEVTIQCSACP